MEKYLLNISRVRRVIKLFAINDQLRTGIRPRTEAFSMRSFRPPSHDGPGYSTIRISAARNQLLTCSRSTCLLISADFYSQLFQALIGGAAFRADEGPRQCYSSKGQTTFNRNAGIIADFQHLRFVRPSVFERGVKPGAQSLVDSVSAITHGNTAAIKRSVPNVPPDRTNLNPGAYVSLKVKMLKMQTYC